MKKYKFEPQACYNEKGVTYRPFFIDDEEIFSMDLSIMLSEDKAASDQQMIMLCEAIKNKTGVIISPGELPSVIKSREIVADDDA